MRIITGMHRSGTSLVARLCHEAGMDMGDPATFQQGDRWNPDGYFEQKEIIGMNMRLIHGPFWKFSYLSLPSGDTILKRARGRAGELRQLTGRHAGRVVKDTRFSLTLPAWIEHGAKVEGIVTCLREPLSVARSLSRRNWISIKRGLHLWVEHTRRLLASTAGVPVRFVRYEDLLNPARADAEISSLLAFLGLDPGRERTAQLKAKVVKPDMNHHHAAEMDYPDEVRALRDELERRRTAA